MLKPPDIASIIPVGRAVPVIAVESIGSTAQAYGDRASQFIKGQAYIGEIVSKLSDTAYGVKLDGGGLKPTLLQMQLGTAAQVGQTLSLKYLNADPTPTFLMTPMPSVANANGASTALSNAAQLIGQFIKDAQESGVSTRYQASAVVTQSPENPKQLALDLNQALSKSGLFYESHLHDLLNNNKTLSAIRAEPQNQGGISLAPMVSQQLAVLENQRVSWQGEVWPGQKMDLDIQMHDHKVEDEVRRQAQRQPSNAVSENVTSEMTLHLPALGKVKAKIHLNDGRLQINLAAENALTLNLLKGAKQDLAAAIVKNGQQLDVLSVVPDGQSV